MANENAREASEKQEESFEATTVTAKTSIRSSVLRRVVPMVALPMLVLGAAFVIALTVIEARTSNAVAEAEDVLTDEIAPNTVNSAADKTAQDISRFLNGRSVALQQLADNRQFQARVLGGDDIAGQVAQQMTVDDIVPNVLYVALDGEVVSDTSGAPARNYEGDAWFLEAESSGSSVTPFTTGSQRGFSFARTINLTTGVRVGILQVRYPFDAVQRVVDFAIADDPVEIAVIDGDTRLMLAETSTSHDSLYMYRPASDAIALGIDLALLDPTDASLTRENSVIDDDTIVSARSLSAFGGIADDFGWVIQARQPISAATAPLDEVRQVAEDVGNTQRFLTVMVGLLLAIALLLAYRAARAMANRITDPVAQLSNQAQLAATQGIPAVVEAAKSSDEELPDLSPFRVNTDDELSVLASSLNTMQDAAVDLAAGQAQLRRQNVARTFVSLGRRNQNLINRQLEFITQLERTEDDPDSLQNLFRLDHLATRMRRNAENLLVLAGEKTPRRWAKPIAVRDVIRAAASEIGDYRRVRISDLDDATVSGNLATDLSHLLAELLENAGTFSPPNSPIDVLGQRTESHYRLAIIDQGIGMDAAALAEANDRLANPVDFSDAPSAYLGLFVVGHLARQLGITVRLANSEPVNVTSNESGGTIAFIDLPVSVLSSAAPTPVVVKERGEEVRPEDVISSGGAPTWVKPDAEEPVAPAAAAAPAPTTAAGFPKRGGGRTSGTTDAGFPKRARVRTETPPAGAPAAEPAAPVTDAGFPKRVAPMVAEPAVPQSPEPSPEPIPASQTGAGFPKRQRGAAPAPSPLATSGVGADAAPRERNPESVRTSLASIREAVAKGKAHSAQVDDASSTNDSADPRTPRRETET